MDSPHATRYFVRDEQTAAQALILFQSRRMTATLNGPFRDWPEPERDAYRREVLLAAFRFWDTLPLTDSMARSIELWRQTTLAGLDGAPRPTLEVVG